MSTQPKLDSSELLRSKELFLAALDRPRPERLGWLERQPDLSQRVREQVELQLGLYEGAPDLGPASDAADHEEECRQALADPHSIGGYRVLRRLGEGGMGTVYACEQTAPVRRLVAVKRLKAGMDSAAIVRRFEAERQALARMGHPGIAQVFDGGVDEDGRLFFAMELVDGPPITTYADRQRLAIDARIRLFLELCSGLEHAHRRGVLHRDIKPANLLVADVDGTALPKIIDFGIAKAVGDDLDERSIHTSHGTVLGTPDYMSPEAESGDPDLDTRADVYSLGVVLHELLTGELPTDALRPSRRFAHGEVGSERRAAARGTQATSLRRLLRDDLDWILLRALHRDRDQRYDSVRELAQDLERFLAHEPVTAGPPRLGYRLRRGLRRHRIAVLSATAVAAGMLGGTALAVRFALAADTAREAAETHLFEVYDRLSRSAVLAAFRDEYDPDMARARELQDRLLAPFLPDFRTVRERLADHEIGHAGWSTTQRRLADHLVERADALPPAARGIVADILFEVALRSLDSGLSDTALFAATATCALRPSATTPSDPRPLHARLLWLDALLAAGRHEEVTARIAVWRPPVRDGMDHVVDALFRARLGAALVFQARSQATGSLRSELLTLAEAHLSTAQRWLVGHEPRSRGARTADAAWIELLEMRGDRDRQAPVLARLRAAVGRRFWSGPFRRTAVGFDPGSEEIWQAVQQLRAATDGSPADRLAAVAHVRDTMADHAVPATDARWQALLVPLCLAANAFGNAAGDAASLALCALADDVATIHAEVCPPAYLWAAGRHSIALLHFDRVAEAERRARAAMAVPERASGSPLLYWGVRSTWCDCLVLLHRFEEGFAVAGEAFKGLVDASGANETNAVNAAGRLAVSSVAWSQVDRAAAQEAVERFAASLEPRYRAVHEAAMIWAAGQDFGRAEVLERSTRLFESTESLPRRPMEWIAIALSRVGEVDEALARLHDALRAGERQGPAEARSTLLTMGGICQRHGRTDGARDHDARAAKFRADVGPSDGGVTLDVRDGEPTGTRSFDGLELPAAAAAVLAGIGPHARVSAAALFVHGELASTAPPALAPSVDVAWVWGTYLQALVEDRRTEEARQHCARLLSDPLRGLDTREGVARFLVTAPGLTDSDRQWGLQVARDAHRRSGGRSARIDATLAEAEWSTGAREQAIERLLELRDALAHRSAEWISLGDVDRRLRQLGR